MAKQKTVAASHHKKRYGQHKKQTHSYRKVYWPYIPMLVMLLSVLIFGNIKPQQIGNVLGINNDISTLKLLSETNNERTSRSISPLKSNEQLNQAAQAKAEDMKTKNYWSHNTPEGNQPWIFIDTIGYSYQKAGENLAYGFSSSNATVSGWMQSPSHRENLLDNEFTEVGFGIVDAEGYQGGNVETIVVAFYATPSDTLPEVLQTNATTTAPTSQKPVTFIASITDEQAAAASFAVGIITGIGAVFLIGRHAIRLKRIIANGEHFIMHHPVLDITVTGIVALGALLLQTAGFVG